MTPAAEPPGTRRIKVNLTDLADAFDEGSWDLRVYFDLETGEVIHLTPDIRQELEAIYARLPDEPPDSEEYEAAFTAAIAQHNAPEWMHELLREADMIEAGLGSRFLQVPEADSRAGYADMVAFTESVTHRRLEERLHDALHGRGPFRRFKDVLLDYPEERDRWFTFKHHRLRERARAWLAEEGIAPIEEEH